MTNKNITLVGAGLVGSLLSIFLKKRGFDVQVYERRPDPRDASIDQGRSINLIVTSRGLKALDSVGLKQRVLEETAPVRGRMIHRNNDDPYFQPYGRNDDECNFSISRAELNKLLITEAEKSGVKFLFAHRLIEYNSAENSLCFETDSGDKRIESEIVFGTDGGPSTTRKELIQNIKTPESFDRLEPLGCDYKELLIPANDDGSYRLDKSALHIWPHGNHMLMALPNLDGSFTVTLYLPTEGELAFENFQTPEKVIELFKSHYPSAVPLMPNLTNEFLGNPVGHLATVRCFPWHLDGKCALVGDAAHGVVPFFGQGMNAGFEDCSVLDDLLNEYGDDWEKIFSEYEKIQFSNGNAIADMAIENYDVMAASVSDPHFLFQKLVEKELEDRFRNKYLSKYSMVTHSLIPYALAKEAGEIQKNILNNVCAGKEQLDEIDFTVAEVLIDEELVPFMKKHQLTTAVYF